MIIRKCLFISAMSVLALQTAYSQKKKPAAPVSIIKTSLDSVSYAIGNDLAQMLKGQGLDSLNLKVLFAAIQDQYAGKKPLLSADEGTATVSKHIMKVKAEKAAKNKAVGEKFLAQNKTKPGVVTLPSGLQYQVITTGTGPKPALTDKVKVHYNGTLIDGTPFDSSIKRGEPLVIGLTGVIKGWTEVLQLMPVGSKWKVFIPADLAYGDRQAGADIKPGSTLIFDMELMGIEPATPAP
ncbi:FKBP-type peptidyl-prolyl cis-trans isomerase [Chitinophaga sp. SYP-B3965]|uniref:FKBP-type peptidyl-prolyl cis-trans isomerase n=1 Tax=Chitinophaga sp. SYP-B3965 TaxID=2663120 RepID=UPI001299738C|nr:FKBP-type peptidyl-prolyl cis-trans isomerase [Chitinophaga sp. SYP-B3965]MRG45955.1 FKBP-type peptidyl-prolyl cis-trans isomerase [Chitinophaga sp. SYP-B3965]